VGFAGRGAAVTSLIKPHGMFCVTTPFVPPNTERRLVEEGSFKTFVD
jgi:hypothetical protein